MAFYGYNGDAGEYPYFNVPYDYDNIPIHSSTSYSSYGYNKLEQIDHNTTYNYYYTTQTHAETSYNVHNFTEPNTVQYEKGAKSNSTKEHDDTLYEEYDPTPYDGGYDIAQTYGKPLNPSNETCYPRSNPKVNGLSSLEFDYGSIPSPYVNHDDQLEEPQKQSKEMDVKDEQQPIENVQQDQDFVVGNNGTIGEYGYDYGGQMQQIIPYGSGLEAMDICETIFGYWPCLEKRKQGRNVSSVEDSSNELWESTAAYLFGNPFGYGGEGRDERYGYPGFSNQNYYYQEQA